ncbi:MAG: TonB family protein, partial [Flavobacteriaceae bacterium]
DPPDEYGVEVNFGYTDKGSGDNTTSTEDVKTSPTPQTPVEPTKETPVEEVKPDTAPPVTEEIMTQDTEDAPEVNSQPQTEPVTETTEPAETETTEPATEPVKEVAPPTPDQSTLDAMDALNGPENDGTSTNGDGDSSTPGNQGDVNGNPYANAYYGGGGGDGEGYGLKGRGKPSKKKFEQPGNHEGKVIVKIWVSRVGKVTKAEIQNSSNPALNKAALKTAKSYKFDAAPNAPSTQQGFVIINFSLGQ